MEPLRIRIKDFYAIADGEIDFTKFSSALIVGHYENNMLMSNGCGKSSAFEAIFWVIFNETRQKKMDDIIRWPSNETVVDFEFIFGRNTYKISRRRSRIAKESSVSLFTKEGEKWVNDSGSTNSETDRKILNLIKIDSKIFLNSVYFKQHDISLFANANPSERKEIIKSIMKLERWDEYQKQAKNKLKFTKDEIEKYLRIISENNNLAVLKIKNEKSIEDIEKILKESAQQQRQVQAKLYSLLELKKENNLNNLLYQLESLNNKILHEKNKGKKLQTYLNNLIEQSSNNDEKYKKYFQLVEDVQKDINDINEQIKLLSKENCLYHNLEESILSNKVECAKLKNIIKDLDETSAMVGLGQCQVCLSNITESNIEHIHMERNQKKIQVHAELLSAINNLVDIEKEYKIRKANKDKLDSYISQYESYKIELIQLKLQKDAASNECIVLNNESKFIESSLQAIIGQIQNLKIESESIEVKIAKQKISNIDIEISDIQAQNKVLTEELNNKNIEYGTLLKEKEYIAHQGIIVSAAVEALTRLGKEKISYEQLVRFFGKEGIQAAFIESVVDELEQYANITLSHICNEPTLIRLRTQKKAGDSWQETLEIDVIMNGYLQTFESLSGGERFRISLALRAGLSEALVKRSGGEIKLLLLDEVDSPLDAYGLNNLFDNIISGLEKRFKILVISHNERIKDRFNNIITINKTNNGSMITQS